VNKKGISNCYLLAVADTLICTILSLSFFEYYSLFHIVDFNCTTFIEFVNTAFNQGVAGSIPALPHLNPHPLPVVVTGIARSVCPGLEFTHFGMK
jgi:hypothetical protein